MRILLQQEGTALYFQNIDSWTPEGSQAMDFLSSSAAIEFCMRNKLNGVQIVLKFQEEKLDIVLPLRGHGFHKSHRSRATP